jgi:hypothetical protein
MVRSNRFARAMAVAGITLLTAVGPVTVTWVAAGPAIAVTESATRTAKAENYKYYIVQPSDHGQPEYLYEIAAKTLGNGDLEKEIFQLNKGRLQPGGGRLENPSTIRPGWILILPASASGPGVHYGPLPPVSTPVPQVSGRPAASAGPVPHAARYAAFTGVFGLAVAAAALFAAACTSGLIYLVRRRKSGDGQSSDRQFSEAVSAAPELPALATMQIQPVGGEFSWFTSQDETVKPVAPSPPASQAEPPLPDWLRMDDRPSVPVGSPAIGRAPAQGALPTRAPRRPERPAYGTMRAEVYQVLSGADEVMVSLAAGPVPNHVRVPGQVNGKSHSHHLAWEPFPYDVPEGGVAFACLGTGDRGCLFLDLGRAPGTIAIGGDPDAATRLAESIAHQLSASSDKRPCMVVSVADALPQPRPLGATWLASLDRLETTLSSSAEDGTTAIVFCEVATDTDLLDLEDRAAAARCRVIPVALTDRAEAPWSLTVMPIAATR